MKKKLASLLSVVVSMTAAGGALFAPDATAANWGGGIEVGSVRVKSDDARNADKNGTAVGASLGLSWLVAEQSYFALGLGIVQKTADGMKNGFIQSVKTQGFATTADDRWAFGGFEVGGLVRVNYGKAMSLRVQDEAAAKVIAEVGPKLAWRSKYDGADMVVFTSALRSLNAENQRQTSLLFGIELWDSMAVSAPTPQG